MTAFPEYTEYDAVGLADLVRKRQVSASEVLEAALESIERLNPVVNAVSIPMADHARRAVKAGLPEGPLTGVPILLKDLDAGNLAGTPTTSGSKLLAANVPDHSSTLVARYTAAGMVFPGRTNVPSFGVSATTEPALYGPTRNPWNQGRSAGGSTGGGAAAVACGMVPVAHATDAAGSLRLPASHCGLFGLKPSRARISAGPDVGDFAGGLGTSHVVSRSVRDSAVMLDVSAGPGVGDPYAAPSPARPYEHEVGDNPGRLHIAFSSSPPAPDIIVDRECVAAVVDAAALCEQLGHVVEEAAPQVNFHEAMRDLVLIHSAAMSSRLMALVQTLGRPPEPAEAEAAALGWAAVAQRASGADVGDAIRRTQLLSRNMGTFLQRYDLLLTPVAAQPALPLGVLDTMEPDFDRYLSALFGHMAFTGLANLTGQPAMSVPLYWTTDGLPVGTQFTAPFGREDLLFRLAGQLEAARPWSTRRPPVWAGG